MQVWFYIDRFTGWSQWNSEACQLHLDLSALSGPSIDGYAEVFPMIAPTSYILPGRQEIPRSTDQLFQSGDIYKEPDEYGTLSFSQPLGQYLAFASISFDASILELMMCVPIGGLGFGGEENAGHFFAERTDQA